MSKSEKKKLGLIPKLLIAIALGTLAGLYLPEWFVRIAVTFSSIFGAFLNFVIPLMIIAFVTKGIADLGEGAGRLLAVTVLIAYASTLVGGSLSYLMSSNIFPAFISQDQVAKIQASSEIEVNPFFEVPITPFFDVTSAIIFAFMMGISISWLRKHGKGEYSYGLIGEFNEIITKVLSTAIVPLLPFFIFGNFSKMAFTGSVFAVLSIFWKIFLCVIALHLLYISALFIINGLYTKKNPLVLIKNQIKGYLTSVATIPVNLECAKSNSVSKGIRDFVIPLGATVHMPGSMITITACTFTILTMYGMDHSYLLMLRYMAILGIAMVAAPGAPGGAVMSALPFLPVVGIPSEGELASLLITLYLTQDSFGTAANISGDTAISIGIDKIFNKHIVKNDDYKDGFNDEIINAEEI